MPEFVTRKQLLELLNEFGLPTGKGQLDKLIWLGEGPPKAGRGGEQTSFVVTKSEIGRVVACKESPKRLNRARHERACPILHHHHGLFHRCRMFSRTKPRTKPARATAKVRHGELSKCRLPELLKPDGPGYMPLYCAVQWIVTHGGTLEINPLDEAVWREAFKDLLNRIASEDVKVLGVRDGATETVSGIHFASCSVDYPFSDPRLDLITSHELCLFSRPYLDDEHWRRGFDDSLEDRRGARWRRLMVFKADVARYWPFAATLDYRTGAPGRPSSMYLVEEEYRARWHRSEAETSISAEAAALADWLATEHPDAPRLKPKTIANKLRDEHRRRVAEAQK